MSGSKRRAPRAKSLTDDVVLVAPADGFMHRFYDLEESIKRIQAFEATRRGLRLCHVFEQPKERLTGL